jgi:hypothetical protein
MYNVNGKCEASPHTSSMCVGNVAVVCKRKSAASSEHILRPPARSAPPLELIGKQLLASI